MKKFNKIVASLMAVMAMTVSVSSQTASAATTNSYPIYLERYAGAPSGAGSFYQSWNYTTTGTSIDFDFDSIYKSSGSSDSYVTCKAYVNGVQKIYIDVHYSLDPIPATVVKGKNGTASVELKDYSSGTHRFQGDFEF